MSKVQEIVERLEKAGCSVETQPVGVIDSSGGELDVVEGSELVGLAVEMDDSEAHVTFYDDSHIHSLFILTQDEILMQTVGDAFVF